MGGAGYLLGLLASAAFFVWVVFQFGKIQIDGRPPGEEARRREPDNEEPLAAPPAAQPGRGQGKDEPGPR